MRFWNANLKYSFKQGLHNFYEFWEEGEPEPEAGEPGQGRRGNRPGRARGTN